jgi:hypothetical protein
MRANRYTVTFQEDGGGPSRYQVCASTAAEGVMNVRERRQKAGPQ